MKVFVLAALLIVSMSVIVSGQSVPAKTSAEPNGANEAASREAEKTVTGETRPFRLLSKPQAAYTDAARSETVEGTVRLKVTLLASGQVGAITPVTALPHGLTEQAIAAARSIKFTPKIVNGVAMSVIVTIDYSFTIFLDEGDTAIKHQARILEIPPTPMITDGSVRAVGGKIRVTVLLRSDGSADYVSVSPDLSPASEELIRQAVWKIKFEPAKRSNGKNVSVHKTIEMLVQ